MYLANIVDAYIPFVVFSAEGMGPSTSFEVFFKDQDFFAALGA